MEPEEAPQKLMLDISSRDRALRLKAFLETEGILGVDVRGKTVIVTGFQSVIDRLWSRFDMLDRKND